MCNLLITFTPIRLLAIADLIGLHEDAPTANGPADNDPFAAGVTRE